MTICHISYFTSLWYNIVKDNLKDKEVLTVDVLKAVVPKSQRTMITDELVDRLNEWNQDPKLMESYKDNILSYIGVLKDGKYKITDYMNAVRYVSYKLLGHSDIDAYAITFPERYQKLYDSGVSRDDMSPYVSAYKKNKLVAAVFEQTIVPSYVLNAPLHQEALNILAHIAMNGRSEMARVNACTSILSNTKPPEVSKIELDVGVRDTDSILELKESLAELAAVQLTSLERGQVDIKQLGSLKPKEEFIEGELDE